MTLQQNSHYNIVQEIEKAAQKHVNLATINKDRQFLQALSNGAPTTVYKNETTGDVYVGNITNNQKTGFGRILYANGSFYEGQWEANKYSGKGFYFD